MLGGMEPSGGKKSAEPRLQVVLATRFLFGVGNLQEIEVGLLLANHSIAWEQGWSLPAPVSCIASPEAEGARWLSGISPTMKDRIRVFPSRAGSICRDFPARQKGLNWIH